MEKIIDACSGPELLYRFVEFLKGEPQHLMAGRPFAAFASTIRRREVPLNVLLLMLLRYCPAEVIGSLLRPFNMDFGTDELRLFSPPPVPYTQPDVCIESPNLRVFIELKLDSKLRLEQVQKYILLHGELQQQSCKQLCFLVIAKRPFPSVWTPAPKGTCDVHSFLTHQVMSTSVVPKLKRQIAPKLEELYYGVRKSVQYGATTWQDVAVSMAALRNEYVRNSVRDTEVRMLSDLLSDLKYRGLYSDATDD